MQNFTTAEVSNITDASIMRAESLATAGMSAAAVTTATEGRQRRQEQDKLKQQLAVPSNDKTVLIKFQNWWIKWSCKLYLEGKV
jgi:hypothetical protein